MVVVICCANRKFQEHSITQDSLPNMKKSTSNQAPIPTEEQLRAATLKALAAEKTAQADKEKARAAKRRLKQARKVYKQTKKTAKKALKRALKAQEDLKKCVDRAAKERKKAMTERRSVRTKSRADAGLIPRIATEPAASSEGVKTAERSTQPATFGGDVNPIPEIPEAPAAGL